MRCRIGDRGFRTVAAVSVLRQQSLRGGCERGSTLEWVDLPWSHRLSIGMVVDRRPTKFPLAHAPGGCQTAFAISGVARRVRRLKPPLRSFARFMRSAFNPKSSIGNRQSAFHPSSAPAGAGDRFCPRIRWLAPPANLRCASGTEFQCVHSDFRIHHSDPKSPAGGKLMGSHRRNAESGIRAHPRPIPGPLTTIHFVP